jgi:hypothetical protein
MSPHVRPDIYISGDVETDGPIPGPFSMLAFGLAVVGTYDGQRFERFDPRAETFYRELQPISDSFQPEALEVNRLDRDRLLSEGEDPEKAMRDASKWVASIADERRPVLVAYPVAFDWSFLYWYLERFTGGSPFGYSSCLDIRTVYQTIAGTVFDNSGKRSMPPWLVPPSPHTHNALDDAIEQGELFANVVSWAMRRRQSWTKEERTTARGDEEDLPSWLAPHLVPTP